MAARKVALPKGEYGYVQEALAIRKEWVIDPAHLMLFKDAWERRAYGTLLKHRAEMAKIESQLKLAEGRMAADMAKIMFGR